MIKKIIMSLLMLSILVACSNTTTKKKNGKDNKEVCDLECDVADMSQYETMKEDDHVFKEVTFAQSNDLLDNKEFTGIIYYGFVDCPWCVEAVPIMNKVAKKYDLTIYYVNKRSQDSIDHPEEEAKAIKRLDEAYGLDKDDEGKSKLFVPEVIVIKDGEIISHHMGTIDGHNAHERKMNEDEVLILKKIYENMFIEIED